jgi:ParB family chromosome partitioning protein
MQQLTLISVENIVINPNQPRRFFNEEELIELAESIKTNGLLQPPLVRPLGENRYELVAGERRFRASKIAGLKFINVIIEERTLQQSAQAALIENIQRVDLNPIETALAIRALMNQFKLSQEEVSVKVAKKRSTVANFLRLLSLPQKIQQDIMDSKISMGHAKVILSLEESHLRLLVHEQILLKNLTVRECEKLIERLQDKTQKIEMKTRNFFLEDLEDKIAEKLGTKVHIIEKTKKTGQVIINYYNLNDFDNIMKHFDILPE